MYWLHCWPGVLTRPRKVDVRCQSFKSGSTLYATMVLHKSSNPTRPFTAPADARKNLRLRKVDRQRMRSTGKAVRWHETLTASAAAELDVHREFKRSIGHCVSCNRVRSQHMLDVETSAFKKKKKSNKKKQTKNESCRRLIEHLKHRSPSIFIVSRVKAHVLPGRELKRFRVTRMSKTGVVELLATNFHIFSVESPTWKESCKFPIGEKT